MFSTKLVMVLYFAASNSLETISKKITHSICIWCGEGGCWWIQCGGVRELEMPKSVRWKEICSDL